MADKTPAKTPRVEQFYAAYPETGDFDAAFFGTKLLAYEFADAQPGVRWRVTEVAKGQKVRDAIGARP